ncbi:MAG: autotransporter outer membrane beta-barrel domain-containing protein, partial [Chlorobiales bacterium]|nr:autotransporter outer membrane beta-barrel domain-containing protein [Chlorobiales bacterium]
SFHFKGSGNTLNLNAPSFIGGRIDLGTNTALSISSGPSHSILWDLSTGTMEGGGPTLSGDVPIFYNAGTQQAATFDPTAIAAGSDMLADISGNVSLLILPRLESRRGCDDGWWMSGFGSTANYEGKAAALDYDFSHGGFALGYDHSVSPDLSLGILAGYGWSWFDANSRFAESWDNTANGWFAALYGRKTLGNVFVTTAFSGGMFNHSDNRFVNDNLAPLGVSSAKASYDSWWLSPEAAIGIELGGSPVNGWNWTPSVRIRYATQWIDGYTETGPSAANAVLDSRNVDMLEGRLELAATRQFGDIARLTGRIGWLNRTSPGDESASIIMIGETTTVSSSSDDHNIGYLGAEMHFDLSNAVSLDVIGEAAVIGSDMSLLRGAAILNTCF